MKRKRSRRRLYRYQEQYEYCPEEILLAIDDSDFIDISKAITVVKDQLDLLDKLFVRFDTSKYYQGTPLESLIASIKQ